MEHSWLLWSTSSMCRYQKNGSASKEGQQRTLQTLELDRDRTTNGLFNGLYSCMQSILPSMGLWRASLFNYMIRTAIGIGYCWRIATVTQMYQSMFRSRVMELATSTGAEVQTAEGTLSIRVCVCHQLGESVSSVPPTSPDIVAPISDLGPGQWVSNLIATGS